MAAPAQRMRDVMIRQIHDRMVDDERIYFLSADLGSPALDALRADCGNRFINVGIAEANLIGVSTGLALEGNIVFAYGIAPFMSMRDFEQIRVNLALLGQIRPMNVNIMSVGAGISYDVSGPTHQCPEDLTVMRTLPNIELISPPDNTLAVDVVDYCIGKTASKYIRVEGKAVDEVYEEGKTPAITDGFCELVAGHDVCILATGYATHMGLEYVKQLNNDGHKPALIDIYMLKPVDEKKLAEALSKYKTVITIEEGFIGKGGLDSMILHLANNHDLDIAVKCFGFKDEYFFDNGGREYLHGLYGLDGDVIIKTVSESMS